MEKMNKKDFFEYFSNMKPMKYYEGVVDSPKGKPIIENENDEYFAMLKKDGEWCRAIIHEEGVLLQSRSISKVTGTYGDKTELVPHITEELKEKWPVGTVLLGELAFEDNTKTSKDVGSILRCKAPKAIERQKDIKLHFYIFDVLAYEYENLVDKPFIERFRPYPNYSSSKYFHVAMNSDGPTSDFWGFAEYVWAGGGEGLVIVRKDMKYAPGKRTAWMTLKVKKKMGEMKAKVIDFTEPKKNYEGTEIDNWPYFVDKDDNRILKEQIFQMKLIPGLQPVTKPYYFGWKNGIIIEYEGRVVKVASGLDDATREYLATYEAHELLQKGKLEAIITGMELTDDSIRHPVFIKLIKNI